MAFNYKTTKEEEAAKKKQLQDEQNLRNHQTYTPGTYEQSDEVKGMWDTISNWQTPTWDKTNNTWWNKLTDTMNAIENREKFSYDVNGDALYQQYKDQYVNMGNMAMMDTMGQAAAMTGGYGNSYAQSVGQQAYQGYMQQLTDKIPELYSLALDKYNSEGQDLYNRLSSYGNLYSTEYGEHRDAVTDSNNQLSHLTNLYGIKSDEEYGQWYDGEQMKMTANQQEYQKLADLLGVSTEQAKYLHDIAYQMQYDNYTTDYQEQRDAADDAYRAERDAVADAQWQKEYDLSNSQFKWQKEQSALAAQLAELEKKYEGYVSPEELAKLQQAENSEATKTFKAAVLTPTEFNRRGKQTQVGGKTKRFDNYTQYIDAVLESQYKDGKLTENEVAALKGYYGIE